MNEAQRLKIWRTSCGVVLAAATAFTLGYGASRNAQPSIGALRPPAWPLFLSTVVVLGALWCLLSPTFKLWPSTLLPELPTSEGAGDAETVPVEEPSDARPHDESVR